MSLFETQTGLASLMDKTRENIYERRANEKGV